jgi:hypothetical protein
MGRQYWDLGEDVTLPDLILPARTPLWKKKTKKETFLDKYQILSGCTTSVLVTGMNPPICRKSYSTIYNLTSTKGLSMLRSLFMLFVSSIMNHLMILMIPLY